MDQQRRTASGAFRALGGTDEDLERAQTDAVEWATAMLRTRRERGWADLSDEEINTQARMFGVYARACTANAALMLNERRRKPSRPSNSGGTGT